MSSSEAHPTTGPNAYLAHHFEDIATQNYAVRLGMWLFLATEVLLFAGLFLGYTVYRWMYPETFQAAAKLLDLNMGTLNTVVLISSSFTVAWAYHAIKVNEIKKGIGLLVFTIVCAFGFLFIKYGEYSHKFHVGLLPGKWYEYTGEGAPPGPANIFFAIYFMTTGLHALHVIIGMTVLIFILVRTLKGRYHKDNYVGVELGALYWHLVDLVWIFLFPLLYLI
ncbi:MAG: cytochrome c oxidase subunit 3 family protein [Deltaproteobacteria bacterium]|nr:cytochrome c oxidase subunit 3 family protein [Deltaproteobacteria bacterium]